ncbi:MAG: SLC13/DASS family transporter [Alphaproteobacteria bacterium]|nr:SLC13/DASS family transporter [Alphaproteobacteria bacterium]
MIVLACALALFAWGKVRHDLVALIALSACLLLGLVPASRAFSGFADPAVVVIVAVLIIGRAVEITGVADAVTDRLAALKAPFALQLAMLLIAAAALSAFMNNIAALAITMPAVIGVCRAANLPSSAGLMPLAFATILGGMTTLIGTPANLILSSVREDQLGAPFAFFAMTPVAAAVALAGVAYICLIGWRLTPRRDAGHGADEGLLATFELGPLSSEDIDDATTDKIMERLKAAKVAILAVLRGSRVLDLETARPLQARDRLLVTSTNDPLDVARKTSLPMHGQRSQADDATTIVAVVGYGSPLIGRPFDEIRWETNGDVAAIAGGVRAAGERAPLSRLRIEPGDQITIHGSASRIAEYARYARLLEVARRPILSFNRTRAAIAVAIYAAAVVASAAFGMSTAFTFAAAAAGLAALRFLPPKEIYSSVDWSVIVLIGAMIPVGQSFQTSGAADIAAATLSDLLSGAPLFWAAAALATATMLLSIFLNNVATAIIMGQIAVSVAYSIGVSPDALLLAVLIGASSDFLTPIGHQNNLLVMGPGAYRFVDYSRMGAPLAVIVIFTTAYMIDRMF